MPHATRRLRRPAPLPPPPPVARRDGGWLRELSELCLRLLVVGATVLALAILAAHLRLVVLPVMLAVVLATVLHPAVRALTARGVPDGLAAGAVLLGALAVVVAVVAILVPSTVDELDELDVSLGEGAGVVQRWLAEGAVGISPEQLGAWLERAEQELRDNAGQLTRGAVTGATLVVEVLAGLALAVVVLFFFLKDGERIWRWVAGLVPAPYRGDAEAIGTRVWGTLGGYLRGVTLVALFDAVFIALALIVVGVPLVLPLAVLTFVGAYVPIVGAFVAGLAAVLVALVALGPVAALAVAASVLAVQQLESNVFQPVVMGRSVRVHPVAVLLGVTAGGVLGGLVGAIVATPLVAVAAAVLRYLRFERAPAGASGGSADHTPLG